MKREVFNFDFDWRFLRGDYEFTPEQSHEAIYMSCKAGREIGVPSKNFDDSEWRKVDLPHDFFCESEFQSDNLSSHGYRERTNGWYRKTFKLPENLKDKQLLFCFEGTAVNAEFYFNGSLMARSFSAYTETVFDVTERAYFGDRVNTIAVYIKGLATEGWWYEGAGIYRHVKLYAKDKLHIGHNGVFAKPVFKKNTENSWNVELKTTIENTYFKPKKAKVYAELFHKNIKIAESCSQEVSIRATDETDVFQIFSVENPKRWDIDSPELYKIKVSVLCDNKIKDTVDEKIGFRTIAVDNKKGFILNGKPVFLKGTCNHQDHAGCGVAVPDSVNYWRVKRLKEMGTNAYRCSHNMVNKAVLDACDELGLIVMDENRRFETRAEVIGYIETMIKRDCNHPSVVFYSLFNEEPLQNTDEGAKIYRKMRSFAENLDDSRIFTGAINGSMEGAGLEMDAVGINYNLSSVEDMHGFHPEKFIFGSENNSAVTTRGCYKTDLENHVLSNYDEEAVPWGQTIGQTWNFVREHKYFGGIFVWTGFDYRGEPSPFGWPSVSSQFGIMDTCGFKKDSYYFNKACFTDEPFVHILPHWNFKKGDMVRVMAVSNCEEVEIFLNGKSLGKKTDDLCSHAEWNVEFEKGTILARAYKNGECVAQNSVSTTEKAVAVKLSPSSFSIKNDGQDTVLINACVVDENGLTVPVADNLIKFEIIGDAVCIGTGNGNPNSHESDNLPQRNLFAGFCQMLLRSERNAENIKVRATSNGLKSDEIVLNVKKVKPQKLIMSAENYDIPWFTASAIFSEKPNVLMKIKSNDNNSFLPVDFLDNKYQLDFHSGYRIYRARPEIKQGGDYILSLPDVYSDYTEIYVNENLVLREEKHINKAECKLNLSPGIAEIRILISAEKSAAAGAGIAQAVRLIKEKQI